MPNETLQYRYASWQNASKVRVFIFFLTTLLTKINKQNVVIVQGVMK